MKIRVSFTLDVDQEAWATEYGLEKNEVREDVQAYVAEQVFQWFNGNSMLTRSDG